MSKREKLDLAVRAREESFKNLALAVESVDKEEFDYLDLYLDRAYKWAMVGNIE